jgi:hypothetical protein
MWAAIRARRAAAAPAVVKAAPVVTPRRTPHLRLWMGLAATLLIGVAVGRFAWRPVAPAAVASAPQPTVTATPEPSQPPAVQPTVAEPKGVRPTPRPDGALNDVRSNSYTVATVRHLENVEALLTSVAASTADARTDSVVARWAKDLLSNTRLLLDSPAARDPVRARLLQDLEVILVQLVQRSPGGDAEERSTLDRTLNKTQIIPRLRSAVPASLHSGTD